MLLTYISISILLKIQLKIKIKINMTNSIFLVGFCDLRGFYNHGARFL